MSKAFVKEDSEAEEEEIEPAELKIPGGAKNYMTPPCFARMREELQTLLKVTRPETVRVVQWAASNGDRSENADYQYGKRRLREIDRRIRFLSKRLDNAQVIDPAQVKADRVLFGATVTIENEEGVRKVYRIVGVDESEPAKGDISWTSPVARAILNLKVGDTATLRTPKGEDEIEIVQLEYR